jgi:predicted Zn-dependent protease
MQQYFNELADFVGSCIRGNEHCKCWLAAESTDFVRFNKSAIRQPGHVRQIMLTLTLIEGARHAGSTLTLSGELTADRELVAQTVVSLRTQLPDLPEDPHFLMSTEVQSTEHIVPSRRPAAGAIVDEVLSAARGYDLVGILASGPIYRGFANSFGQRNWHEVASFNLDFSLYLSKDKAVKTGYAGFEWDSAVFKTKFAEATKQLELLKRDPVSLQPGAYRAYFTPTALNEIVGMMNWAGLSEKAFRTRHSSLRRMRDEGWQLNRTIRLTENTAGGLAPGFQADGFIKPDSVALVEEGRLVGSMVSPRSAREYGIAANGADNGEAFSSIDLAAGDLPQERVLAELGTGVYISNLWYLNFSDRASCRMTGMTRFATFWVENGEIKAPLNVMRFDDSLFRLLGDNLVGLTKERELLIDGESYGGRSTGSALLPGALVRDFTFVL